MPHPLVIAAGLLLAGQPTAGAHARAHEDALSQMISGQLVHIVASDLPPGYATGRVTHADSETIILDVAWSKDPARVRRDSIARLQIGHTGTRAGRGALVGTIFPGIPLAAFFIVVGEAAGFACAQDYDCGRSSGGGQPDRVFAATVGLTIGTLIGGLIGSAVKTTTWKEIPLHRVHLRVGPGHHGGAQVALTLRF